MFAIKGAEMQPQDLLEFLRKNQPMPDTPDEERLALFRQATTYFYDHPMPECIPLFLNAFAEWEDWSLHESVQSVLKKFKPAQVIPHLKKGCGSLYPAVRFWCVDTARYFPDDSLLPELSEMFDEERVDMHLVAASALEALGSAAARALAARLLIRERDEGVREILEAVIQA